MTEVLSRISPSDLPVVLTVPVVVLGGLLAVTIIFLIRTIQRHRELETATSLVMEMLDRGIPPEDITAILKTMGLEPPADCSAQGLRLKIRTREKQASDPSKPGTAEAPNRR